MTKLGVLLHSKSASQPSTGRQRPSRRTPAMRDVEPPSLALNFMQTFDRYCGADFRQ